MALYFYDWSEPLFTINDFNRFFDGIGQWTAGVGEDAGNRRFGSAWAKLTRDLLFSEGEDSGLTFKPHLWADIRKVIVPMLVEKVRVLSLIYHFHAHQGSRLDTSLFLVSSTPTTRWISSSRTLPFKAATCSPTSSLLRLRTI